MLAVDVRHNTHVASRVCVSDENFKNILSKTEINE